ncbi:MAG: EamA family transporter [Thermoanaerobaculaceae bacterium]|nr:EamA family transporter [Thermoanaerobaculaceae bacterium]
MINKEYFSFIFLTLTVFFTVLGQILVKKGVSTYAVGNWMTGKEIMLYLLKSSTNIYVLSGLFCAGLAAACWILAVGKLKLSYAYPFIALTFVFVPLFAKIFFREEIPLSRWIGIGIILLGVWISFK